MKFIDLTTPHPPYFHGNPTNEIIVVQNIVSRRNKRFSDNLPEPRFKFSMASRRPIREVTSIGRWYVAMNGDERAECSRRGRKVRSFRCSVCVCVCVCVCVHLPCRAFSTETKPRGCQSLTRSARQIRMPFSLDSRERDPSFYRSSFAPPVFT